MILFNSQLGSRFSLRGFGSSALVALVLGAASVAAAGTLTTADFNPAVEFSETSIDGITPISSGPDIHVFVLNSLWDQDVLSLLSSGKTGADALMIPNNTVDLTPTPEPSAFMLLGMGIVGLAAFRKFCSGN